MSTLKDWSTDEVIQWLQNDLKLNSIEPTVWQELGVNGNMLNDLLDDDGDDILKDELGIKSKLHRKCILNGIKRLKEQKPESPPTVIDSLILGTQEDIDFVNSEIA